MANTNHNQKTQRLAQHLVEMFLAKMKQRADNLQPGEALMLRLPDSDTARPIKKVHVTVRHGNLIDIEAGWLDGSETKHTYSTDGFNPSLDMAKIADLKAEETHEKATPPVPQSAPKATATPQQPAASALGNQAAQSLFEQLIGHVTALGILQAQVMAAQAQKGPNAQAVILEQRRQALAILEKASVSVPGLNDQHVRAKAKAALEQLFDSIHFPPPPGTLKN